MKTTILAFTLISIIIAVNAGPAKVVSRHLVASDGIKATVAPEKSSYVLGEPIDLRIALTNENDTALIILVGPTVATGFLKILVSKRDGEFLEYHGPGWGRREGDGLMLGPGKSFETSARVLWNIRPEVSHLNPDSARVIADGRMMSKYAFPEAGVYSVKAAATLVVSIDGGKGHTVESAPVEITVTNPTGADLELWQKIQENDEIASFIHSADMGGSPFDVEKRRKFVEQVEKIIQEYPNSLYSKLLQTSLSTFRESESKRTKSNE